MIAYPLRMVRERILNRLLLLFLGFLFAWQAHSQGAEPLSEFSKADQAVFTRFQQAMDSKRALPTGDLLVETARFFLGVPYVAGTLEKEPEELVINLRELDCMTLVENTVALAWTLRQGLDAPGYQTVLRRLRYREPEKNPLDYTDRLHYTSDWMYENEQRGYLKDITQAIGGQPWHLHLSFMSTHPNSYKQLQGDTLAIARIAAKEKEISARSYFYIPQEEIQSCASRIQNGDIIGFVTTLQGLDISHVGIAYWRDDTLTFIHASFSKKQVIVNEASLYDYVQSIKRNCGIVVLRAQF